MGKSVQTVTWKRYTRILIDCFIITGCEPRYFIPSIPFIINLKSQLVSFIKSSVRLLFLSPSSLPEQIKFIKTKTDIKKLLSLKLISILDF